MNRHSRTAAGRLAGLLSLITMALATVLLLSGCGGEDGDKSTTAVTGAPGTSTSSATQTATTRRKVVSTSDEEGPCEAGRREIVRTFTYDDGTTSKVTSIETCDGA